MVLPWDFLQQGRNLEVIAVLDTWGASGIREIKRAIGKCSLTTIQDSVDSLLMEGYVAEEVWHPDAMPETTIGPIPYGKRLMKLTPKGEEMAKDLRGIDSLPLILLPKTRENLPLIFLDILKEIKGTTRLMKLQFHFLMAYKSHIASNWETLKFRPHLFGPYSKQLSNDCDELRELGFIDVRTVQIKPDEFAEYQPILHVYKLTEKGTLVASKLSSQLTPQAISEIGKMSVYNQMKLRNLLKYIYRNYPAYVTHSKIKSILEENDESPEGP